MYPLTIRAAGMLTGALGIWMRGVHGLVSQVSPSGTHVPQLGLQHTSPLPQG